MRDYGKVYTRFWTDPDIQPLSDQTKLLALYLLSGPHATALGAFRLPDGYVTTDLGKGFETVSERFAELFAIGFATRCEKTGWVFVHRFLKWNAPENPNQVKSVRKLFSEVPQQAIFYNELRALLDGLPFGDPNPSERVTKPFRNQEQEQKQKQKKEQKKEEGASAPAAAFVLPDWMPEETWKMFLDHRKALKKPMTANAKNLAIKQLNDLRCEGHDPVKLVELCVASGWSSFYSRPETRTDRPALSLVSGEGYQSRRDAL